MKKFLLSLVSLFMLTVASWAGEPTKVLTFPDYNDKSISSYTSEWTATVDGDVWTLNAFNNNSNGWAFVKCGRKGNASTATITSPAVDVAITDIVITVDATKNVERATLTVFNDATVVNDPIDITADFVAGDVHVAIPQPAAGYSYKLTIDNLSASANGTTQISKIALYEAGQYEYVEPVHIANTAETAYTVAEAYNLIDAGEALTDVVYVKGIISQVDSYNDTYKSIQYWISDDGTTEKQLECYSGKGLNGADFASVDDVKVGAVVIVKGNLKKYNTIYEFDKNNELVSYDFSYLTNPSFEYAAKGVPATAQSLTNGGEFYGWTLPNLGTSFVNISIGSATECNGQGVGIPTPKDGSFYYFARRGWNSTSSADATLSTTLKELPAGHYALTFAYKGLDSWEDAHKSTGSYLKLIAKAGEQELAAAQTPVFDKVEKNGNGNKFTGDANWKEATLNFDVEVAGDVVFEVVHHFVGGTRTDLVIDDVRVAYKSDADVAKDALQAEIETAQALLADETKTEGRDELAAAIATATAALASNDVEAINAAIAALQEAENAFREANTVQPGTDMTSYIINPSFETGNYNGWTVTPSVDTGVYPNSNGTYTTEGCDGDYLFNIWWTGHPITQTVKELPNGLYELKVLVTNAANEEGNKPCIYLLGNGTHGEPIQGVTSSGVFAEGTLQFYVTDGTATIGVVGGNADGSFNPDGYYWYKADNFRLTFVEALPNLEDVEIPTGKMSVAAQAAINAALEAQDVVALLNAVEIAKSSIAAYAEANEAIAQANAILNGTNVATAEAHETFSAAINTAWTAYDEAMMNDDEAKNIAFTLGTAVTGWHAGAEGAAVKYMESAYGLDGFDQALYVNTWSVEGYEDGTDFYVPFYEYFVDANKKLAANTFTTTVNGLEPGLYEVSALVRVQLSDGATVPAGVTLNANDGEQVSALGEEMTSKNMFLKETTATAMVGADGVLSININVLDGNNVHWLSFKNVKYTLMATVADLAYEAANEAMVSGKNYFVSSVVGDNTYYLKKDGYLTANKAEAGIFNIVSYPGNADTYKELGWRIPEFTNGGDNKNEFTGASKTHLIPGNQHRVDFETQVLYLNEEGNYAIRSTNSTSASWGAAAFWTVVEDNDADGLPNATYVMNEMPYIWNIEPIESDARCAAYQKTQEWPAKLIAAWTSNAKDPEEGSFEALTDRDYATFFHSSWRPTAPDEDHYLQAELPEAKNDFIFYFKKRSTNNNNRPTAITISASKDGENFTDITSITEGLPTDQNVIDYTSQKIDLGDSYNFLRFTVTATNTGATANGHVFFTFSEFYIMNGGVENYYNISDWTTLTDEDVANINALDEQINAAQKAWAEKKEVFALKMKAAGIYERIQAYAAGVSGEFAAQMALYAALDGVDIDSPTTVEEANAVIQQLNEIAANFVAALRDVEDRDVTGAFLDNSTPTSDAEGWTIENGPATFDAGNDVAEFWNHSAASIKQTVFLPAGNYKLTVQAVTRSDMVALLVAGDNQTELVTMPSTGTSPGVDYVNTRVQVNTWFTAGNGWNEVEFTLDEPANVEVGLIADNATGDHWMVWRSFVITKIGTHIDPNDMTSLIVNPAYLGVEGSEDLYAGWNHTENGWKARSYEAPMNLITYSGNCDFEVNQTIENVPAGLYRLSVHAFYRAGSLEDEQAKVAAGAELEKELVMYANVNDADNKYSKKVMNLSEGAADALVEGTGVEFAEGQYVANSAADARTWYIAGEYKNEVLFNVFEDGSVTIGLSKAVGLASDYCPVGAWSLYRVGDADETEATPDPKPAVPASLALATVTYDGQDVVFNEENVASIDGSYDAAKELVVVAEADEAVSVEVAYPTEIGQDQIVITVADKDVENFPENKATYTIVFSVPTAINFIKADENTVIYDVTGRRVSKAVKGGLYIINGKKTLVK